jgi:NAD(P)-dependent dehydrogenase (short-subunit alcohol dehydrogenase family)
MGRLEGKVAIITGGGGGIGGATAERFVSEGANVVVADISIKRAQQVADRIGHNVHAIYLDAANEISVKAIVDETIDRFGRIDILHNNHAWLTDGMPDDRSVIDTPVETWDRTMAINLRGYFLTAKFVVPHMIEQGGGSVINMTSDAGIRADTANISYGVSKAGVIMLTRTIATHHGRQGIRCNAIAPGLVVTPYVHQAASHLVSILKRHTPSVELGEPEDAAALCAFLAADESRFINGQIISCDGGLLAHMPQLADLGDWEAVQKSPKASHRSNQG